MHKKTKIIALLFGVLPLLLSLGACGNDTEALPEPAGELNAVVLKAGQADAIVLRTENHSVIIDCGEKDDGGKITEYLAENNISNVDYLFITHFDKDHVGGFPEVAESITADNIVVPDYEGTNSEYKKYLKTIEEKELTVSVPKEDFSFVLDDTLFEVSVPKKQTYDESDNDFSLVISVTHGDNTFLFAGDAEADRLSEIMAEFGHKYDFLKLPHHGRYNKNTRAFINTVKPKYTVICDSKKNPAEEKTTEALQAAGSLIYSTMNGDVYVASDGREIKITQ